MVLGCSVLEKCRPGLGRNLACSKHLIFPFDRCSHVKKERLRLCLVRLGDQTGSIAEQEDSCVGDILNDAKASKGYEGFEWFPSARNTEAACAFSISDGAKSENVRPNSRTLLSGDHTRVHQHQLLQKRCELGTQVLSKCRKYTNVSPQAG